MLEALIYISAADPSIRKQDINDILASALRNNKAEGLTGALVFSGSIFVQILEGSTSGLDDMMRRIKADSRHDAVTVVAARKLAGDGSQTGRWPTGMWMDWLLTNFTHSLDGTIRSGDYLTWFM